MNKKMLEMALLTASLLMSAGAMADTSLFSPYSADYDLERKGIGSAKSTFSLTKQADGSYEYKSVAQPTGVASLFIGALTQTSDFKVVNGRPQSTTYTFDQAGKKPQQETVKFDWGTKKATSSEDGKAGPAALTDNSVDTQLVVLMVAADAAAGKLPDTYQIVDHGEAVPYLVKALPDAKLRLQSGNFETKVITLSNPERKRTITAWLAPNLHYLPVQIRQADKNTYTFTLLHIAYGDEAPAAAPAAATK